MPSKISLPIDDFIAEIQKQFLNHQNLIITAEPGAGKTTRVPPALLGQCKKKILVLEPRRVATVGAASRIAEENEWTLGNEIGYQVRYDSKFSKDTRLVFLTEALLAKKIVADPLLSDVDVVILDEFHERSVHADLALGLLKELQELERPDLKIILMSATLDTGFLQNFLPDSFVFQIPGKSFPMQIEYLQQSQMLNTDHHFIQKMASLLRSTWNNPRSKGHLLMFLPGLSEIERVAREIEPHFPGGSVHKLYGLMSLEEQRAVLKPSTQRKVILSTNIAESSVTIDGVDTVIDCGLTRSTRLDARTGLSRLETTRISKASATQRAGRSARQKEGFVLRLWSNLDERSMSDFESPEILRVNLDEILLLLSAMGITEPQSFSWLSHPSGAQTGKAMEELRAIGAVEKSGQITQLGKVLLDLPLSPRIGKLLLHAREVGLADFGARACAVLSEREFLRTPISSSQESDLLDRVDLVHKNPGAKRVYDQLRTKPDLKSGANDVHILLMDVFSDRLARRRSKGQRNSLLISGRGAALHENSQVKNSEFFLSLQLQTTAQSEDPIIFWAHGIPTELALKHLRQNATLKKTLRFEKENMQFWTDEAMAVGNFMLEEPRQRRASIEEIGGALGEKVVENWNWFLTKNTNLQKWWTRYLFFCHEEGLEQISLASLKAAIEQACYGENALPPLFEKDFVYFLEQALDANTLKLFKAQGRYPEQLLVPSGRTHWIDYSENRPKLEVKLQELFGLLETPKLGKNQVPLTLVMLSPNGSPMQTTQDLVSFWKTGYFEVKAELKTRYPKHPWPDDPLTAEATHKRKPRLT